MTDKYKIAYELLCPETFPKNADLIVSEVVKRMDLDIWANLLTHSNDMRAEVQALNDIRNIARDIAMEIAADNLDKIRLLI